MRVMATKAILAPHEQRQKEQETHQWCGNVGRWRRGSRAMHRGRITTRGGSGRCVLDVGRFYIALFSALQQTAYI